VLSRTVWDILTILPTSPSMLECFKHFPTHESKDKCQVWLKKDLDPSNLQKLMYSLYIVESLVQMGVEKNSDEDELQEVCLNRKKHFTPFKEIMFSFYKNLQHLFIDINKWII